MRLQYNDAPAWKDLIHLYTPLVFHWCRRAGLPEQECPDVVQEVFRAVHVSINGFSKTSSGGTFRGWLRTVTRNKVLDHFRHVSKRPTAAGGSEAARQLASVPDDDDDPNDQEAELRAEHALFARAFEMIRGDVKPHTWQAFYRVVVEGKDSKTVAEELQMQPTAVRVAKSRVLKRLREQLGDLLE